MARERGRETHCSPLTESRLPCVSSAAVFPSETVCQSGPSFIKSWHGGLCPWNQRHPPEISLLADDDDANPLHLLILSRSCLGLAPAVVVFVHLSVLAESAIPTSHPAISAQSAISAVRPSVRPSARLFVSSGLHSPLSTLTTAPIDRRPHTLSYSPYKSADVCCQVACASAARPPASVLAESARRRRRLNTPHIKPFRPALLFLPFAAPRILLRLVAAWPDPRLSA
jgi:hypothetical protein